MHYKYIIFSYGKNLHASAKASFQLMKSTINVKYLNG